MILIFPWARKTTDGKKSPKDYPFWLELVSSLHHEKFQTHQISVSGEPDIGCGRRSNDLSLGQIQELLRSADTWISVDSFLPHMAWSIGEAGVVIFGPSDPEIYGHPKNINLLKDRRFLRERQFGLWSQQESLPADAFVSPQVVRTAVLLSIGARMDSKKVRG